MNSGGEKLNELERVVRDLLRPEGAKDPEAVVRAWEGPDAEALRVAVDEHRLEAALIDALERAGASVDPALAERAADDRVVRLLAGRVLNDAAAVFDGAGIRWAVFKGPVAAGLMPRPHLRTFNDLDLLVEPARFGDAIDALVEAGAEEQNQNWSAYHRHRVGEVPMAMRDITVDLHWHLVGLGRDRDTMAVDVGAILDRLRLREVDGRERPIFAAEDLVVYLALHAALGGATRLDQLRDLAVAISADPLDWGVAAERAEAWQVTRLVAHALDRAAILLGAHVPPPVLERLGGRGLERRRRLDEGRSLELRSFPVASRRDRPRQAAKVLFRRGFQRVWFPGRQGWDFTDERGRLYHARYGGGDSARREFLEAVAAGMR